MEKKVPSNNFVIASCTTKVEVLEERKSEVQVAQDCAAP